MEGSTPGTLRDLRAGMRIPVIAAPMFLVSGPDLVVACCRAGVIGSFPTINARTPEILDEWLTRFRVELGSAAGSAPPAANLVVHRTNPRLADDLAVVAGHEVPVVIASVGSPAPVVAPVHRYGGLVLADVASVKHARGAVGEGIDGLVLLCAGAGGNTGWLNPFAFVAEVREFYDGPLVVAGSVGDGAAVRAIEVLGADLAYVGTRFIATAESMASDAYREMLVRCNADDVKLTDAVTGIPANFLGPILEQADLRPPAKAGSFDMEQDTATVKAWKDVWSAGQAVGRVKRISTAAEVVAELERGYRAG